MNIVEDNVNSEKTWLMEVFDAVSYLGGVASLEDIYNQVESTTKKELNSTWKCTVRAAIYSHSSDSEVFSGKPGNDIFCSVDAIGSGIWGLRSKIAETKQACDINELGNENPDKVECKISRIIRDTKLVKELKSLHQHKCQICGHRIVTEDGFYSEGHHLKPLGKTHNGPDVPGNVIVLCPNHHVEFDYGLIAIDPKTSKICHKDPANSYIGNEIQINKHHAVNVDFLKYHFKNIFN